MWIPFHHPSCTCGDCIISCIGDIEDNTPSSNDLRIYNDPASDEDGVKVGVDFGSTDETGTNSDNVTIRENYDILEGENFSDMFLRAVLRLMTGLVFFSDRVSPRMYDRLRLDVVNKHGFYLVNVFYKRVALTSELPTPLTLRTYTSVQLNYIIS
jgi:hypothetical protein